MEAPVQGRPAGDRERTQAFLKRLAGVMRNYRNRCITPGEALADIEQIVREMGAQARREGRGGTDGEG